MSLKAWVGYVDTAGNCIIIDHFGMVLMPPATITLSNAVTR